MIAERRDIFGRYWDWRVNVTYLFCLTVEQGEGEVIMTFLSDVWECDDKRARCSSVYFFNGPPDRIFSWADEVEDTYCDNNGGREARYDLLRKLWKICDKIAVNEEVYESQTGYSSPPGSHPGVEKIKLPVIE